MFGSCGLWGTAGFLFFGGLPRFLRTGSSAANATLSVLVPAGDVDMEEGSGAAGGEGMMAMMLLDHWYGMDGQKGRKKK